MNSDFYILFTNFLNILFNIFSIPFSISFKYYFFIHYLFFFYQLHIFKYFFIQHLIIIIEKKHLKNGQYLMGYCSWAKKNSSYRESIGNSFYGVILYYREYFAFTYTSRDALNHIILLVRYNAQPNMDMHCS